MKIRNKGFRLIAVRPLKERDTKSKYLKVLKENQFYLFYDDYKIVSNTIEKKTKEELEGEDVPLDFYKIADTNLNISISAIIGKNGDGKSSIIELIIRILNNFAYASGFVKKHEDLKPVEGLWAELYYEIGGEPISIVVKGDDIQWILPCNKTINLSSKETISIEKSYLEEYFFYTQVSNYSLYAYNSNEFKNESNIGNGDWISGVFHKNDGYQTPVVLNPMRTGGNIEINRENGLNKDRLISLFLTKDLTKDSFRWINEKQCSLYFEIKLKDGKSKLEENFLLPYFIDNPDRIDSLDAQTMLSPNTKLGTMNNFEYCIQSIRNTHKRVKEHRQVDPNTHLDLSNEFISSSILLENLFSISEKISPTDIEYYINLSEKLLVDNKLSSNLRGSLSTYLTVLEDLLPIMDFSKEKTLVDTTKFKIVEIRRVFSIRTLTINDLDPAKEKTPFFNLTHLYYIIIVVLCNEIWREKLNDKSSESENITNKLYDYIVYKTLSIASKYPNYKEYRTIFEEKDLLTDSKLVENLFVTLDKLIDKIYEDVNGEKSHITLKIRQAINFFDHASYYSNINNKEKYIDITTFCNDIEKIARKTHSLSSDKVYDAYDYFFPPIFSSDVILKQIDVESNISGSTLMINNELFPEIDVEKDLDLTRLSQLSSGERQQLNTVSAVIYHLRNINSVQNNEDNLVKYKHINLIFEEIELYFHPEYQRTFLSFLLFHLTKANLKRIESIDICFVTHSPFILSDIPQQNILALEKGIMKRIPFDTLGANIHELLGHNFLLNHTIGEIVRIKIDEFLKIYGDFNKYKKENYKFDYSIFCKREKEFKFLIDNLGESYLRNILKGYYMEMVQENPEELEILIENARKELNRLENKRKL